MLAVLAIYGKVLAAELERYARSADIFAALVNLDEPAQTVDGSAPGRR